MYLEDHSRKRDRGEDKENESDNCRKTKKNKCDNRRNPKKIRVNGVLMTKRMQRLTS